jgi:hypothetical protein
MIIRLIHFVFWWSLLFGIVIIGCGFAFVFMRWCARFIGIDG